VPTGKFYDEGEVRRIVAMEVQNQLHPLRTAVEKQGATLRSIYSNGSGGPPGFLENARREDKDTFDRIFERLDCLRPLEDFVTSYKATETQREKDRIQRDQEIAAKVDASSKRMDKRVALAGLAVAILALLVGWLTYRDSQRKVSDLQPQPVPSMQTPQRADLPLTYSK
jgi:hypothetical protein